MAEDPSRGNQEVFLVGRSFVRGRAREKQLEDRVSAVYSGLRYHAEGDRGILLWLPRREDQGDRLRLAWPAWRHCHWQRRQAL